MAILGFQVVSTLLGATFLSKLINYASFARFILCHDLFRFDHPSTNEIIKASNIYKSDKNKKGKKLPIDQTNQVNISKSLNIELKRVPVTFGDIINLHYFTDYQWLIDFSLCSFFVFLANEFVYGCIVSSTSRVNLSIIWCLLGTFFSLKVLGSMTKIYFTVTDTADMIIILMSGFSFLVFSMMVLILPETHLSFSFENGYKNFSDAVYKSFPDSNRQISLVTIKGTLAILSAILGAFFTHPGLRFGKMYMDAVNVDNNRVLNVFLHISFVAPMVVMSLWLTSVQRALMNLRFGSYQLTQDDILSLRVYLSGIVCLSRVFMVRIHLQSYLNLADLRIKSLKKEAGKISIIEYQKIIARIFYCLCLVALQYLAPIILCGYVTLLYKSLGGLSWLGSYNGSTMILGDDNNVTTFLAEQMLPKFLTGEMQQSVESWSISITCLRAVFTPLFYQAIVGYLLWFILAAIQLTSFLGLVYYRNLDN